MSKDWVGMRDALRKIVLSMVPPLRRLQQSRDDLQASCDGLQARLAEAERESPLCWLRYRPVEHSRATVAVSDPPRERASAEFISRIIRSYQAAVRTSADNDPSMWTGPLAAIKRNEQAALMDGDIGAVGEMLHNPVLSRLCYGFDELFLPLEGRVDPASVLVSTPEWLCDNLRRLAEAVGAIRLANPESWSFHPDVDPGIETIIEKLDQRFGVRLIFPNPYAGEIGVPTSRGIVSYRTIQAIYQAWRVVSLARQPRVLEIGAGLGRTAFYLKLFGVTEYVAVDVPLSTVAQAHFLGRTIGEDAISLYSEEPRRFRLLPDFQLDELAGDFDVALNVDALTEMARSTADTYLRFIEDRCRVFLSINHECNAFTVRDLYADNKSATAERHPYWMRRGYVEEVIRFRPANELAGPRPHRGPPQRPDRHHLPRIAQGTAAMIPPTKHGLNAMTNAADGGALDPQAHA